MKTKIFFSAIMLFLGIGMTAQQWFENIPTQRRTNPNFFDIQNAFNTYTKGSDVTKMKGYKQYKRWEWFMEARIDASGHIPSKKYWDAIQQLSYSRKNSKEKLANWTLIGPQGIPTDINSNVRMGVGRVDNVIFHPSNPDIIWVCAPTGGLWKSEDNGLTWQNKSDNLAVLASSDLVINYNNPDIMYLATGDRDAWEGLSVGVLKSTDGGETWQSTGLFFDKPELQAVNRLLMHPTNPDIIVAATAKGIYKTINAGADWNLVYADEHCKSMEFNTANPDIIYAATYNFFGGAKIIRSVDGGESFTAIANTGIFASGTNRITLAVTPANPNVVFALACKQNTNGMQGLFKSIDGGDSWTKVLSPIIKDLISYSENGIPGAGQGFYNLSIAVSNIDENIVFVGGTHLWKSIDGGVNFTLNENGYATSPDWVHADFHALKFHPLSNKMYNGNDGGVYCSDDVGENWYDISSGIQILQFYRFGVSQTNDNLVLTGAQDNGGMLFDGSIGKLILFADGGECFFDYSNPQVLYTSAQYGMIFRSTNGGHSLASIQAANDGTWMIPFEIDPNDPQTIYAGYSNLYKSTKRGAEWQNISSSLNLVQPLECVRIAPSNSNCIYIATYFNIWRTTDGGTSWQEITSNLPSHDYSTFPYDFFKFYDIAVSADNPDKAWVVFSNFSEGNKVFKTTNGGSTWENISLNLPNIPVNCIVNQPQSNDGVYIGTDAGVFYIDNELESWIDYSEGLPNIIVSELEIQFKSNKLKASTYGRSIWETPLYRTDYQPYTNFGAENTNLCENDSITFIEFSGYSPTSFTWQISPTTYHFGVGSTEHSQNPVVIFETAGEYTISLTAENQFGSQTKVRNNFVKVDAPAVAAFSYEINELVVDFQNLAQNENFVRWNFGDGSFQSTEDNPTHAYPQAGSYDVQLTAKGKCGDDVEVETITVIGSGIDQNYLTEFSISPNPFKWNTVIAFTLSKTSSVSFEIYDITGQLVFSTQNFVRKEGSYNLTWNGTDTNGNILGKGVYVYHFKINDSIKTGKIVFIQ